MSNHRKTETSGADKGNRPGWPMQGAKPRRAAPFRTAFAVAAGAVLYGATTLPGAQVGAPAIGERRDEAVRRHFGACGQGHVFRFWDRLAPSERERLLEQAETIGLETLLRALEAARRSRNAAPPRLEPVAVERIPEHGGDPARREQARRCGEELLAAGRVALLVVAGGQATRLGYEGPKGAFPIGPVTRRSLFEIQAQKLRRLRARYGRPLPWYVMTSDATDAATREHFARHGGFGLPVSDVVFFRQGMVPSFDFEGRLILCEPGRIMQNPDGHGGSLTALLRSGALADLERRGADLLFYYQVDNPLVRLADPVFLGFHALAGAEVSCKVVRKRDPLEKAGIVARVNGRIGVVEYTELDPAQRDARDASGELVFWAGNTAIHAFDTVFVRRVAADADRWLPFHASEKAIPTLDAAGRTVVPATPNGLKLERFVFDALPAARGVSLVETARADEFSPVKNASGSDSPEAARRDLVAQYARWLRAAGIEPPAGLALEIDHARVDGPEDLRELAARDLADLNGILRTGPGVAA
jgi:UDP-N-acetylglucosamine/UDP-N-acetylgalactosamine diphosphorylase